MLSQFDGKRVTLTTEDGEVFSGTAEVLPSGYGLHEFGRAEESIQIGETVIFQSEIRQIALAEEAGTGDADPRRFDNLMGELLEGPYRIADVFPRQVSKERGAQYFAAERYWLQPERLGNLRRKQAEILIRLNCYYEMTVSFDSCESWETSPEPIRFAGRLESMTGNDFLRAVFAEPKTMIDIEPCDTYMTVYSRDQSFVGLLGKLCAAEGLFLWEEQAPD